jgi:hypothetical protein
MDATVKKLPEDSATNRVPKLPWIERSNVTARYVILAIFCFLVSTGGVGRAVHLACANEGGRGGALATILSLSVFLLRRDYGAWQYQDRIANMSDNLSDLDQIKEKVDALQQAMLTNSEGQTAANYCLAGGTVIGTLFWGFGDIFATWFMRGPSHCLCSC